MDIESAGPNGRNRGQAAEAYADDQGQERRRYLGYGLLVFVVVLMLRNMMVKDYRSESKAILYQGGRDQVEIDAIVPKTREEMLIEAKRREAMLLSIPSLQGNITLLQERIEKLEKDVNTPHS